MDDDIDIEEHDVLEDPVIKNIFPDLSIIKKEISLYEDKAFPVKSEDVILTHSYISTCEDSNCDNSQCTDLDDVTFVAEIKNSKETQLAELQTVTEKATKFQNKFILGSRPAQTYSCQENHYERNVKPFSAKVYLGDIGSYLKNSGKYCKICCILFPEKRNLETHNKDIHERKEINTIDKTKEVQSYLKNSGKYCKICCILFPEERKLETHNKDIHERKDSNTIDKTKAVQPVNELKYKCLKCFHDFAAADSLQRHLINIHGQKFCNIRNPKVSRSFKRTSLASKPIINKSKTSTNSICFHCKKIFPSQKSLIEHIYNVLQSSTLNQQTQQKLIESQKKSNKTYIIRRKRKKILLDKRIKTQNNEKVETRSIRVDHDDTILLYRCYYCSAFYKDKETYHTHLANKHKDKDVILTNRVMFDPHCKFCSVKQDNIRKYNHHLYFRHADMSNKTFKIEPEICLEKIEFILARKQSHISIQNNKSTDYDQLQENTDFFQEYQESTTETKSNKVEEVPERKRKENKKSIVPHKKIKIENMSNEFEETHDLLDFDQFGHLVLKGILFKCKRCDIHFLTSRCAMNHSEHMEMLINWKCLVCLKIFKKEDEFLHILQHSYSNEFVVYELSEPKLSRVLYKCPKCAIHFNDVKYAFHFKRCGKIVTESTYCNACDILLERSARSGHDFEHKNNKKSLADFTIVTSDMIISSTIGGNKIVDKEMSTMSKELKPLDDETKSSTIDGNKIVDKERKTILKKLKPLDDETKSSTIAGNKIVDKERKTMCKELKSLDDEIKNSTIAGTNIVDKERKTTCKELKLLDEETKSSTVAGNKIVDNERKTMRKELKPLDDETKSSPIAGNKIVDKERKTMCKELKSLDDEIKNSTIAGNKIVDKERKTMRKELKPLDNETKSSTLAGNKIVDKERKTMSKELKPLHGETKNVETLKMSYCDTCRCFISHNYLRTVHKEGRCSHIVKHICQYCGLIMTNQSLQSHRKRHQLEKDLKLQDFKFYDVKTNKRMLPPIPEYPRCNICNVRFISKVAVTNHVCNENDFLTCPVCDIKLSDEVFKLHLSFHHYSMKNSNSDLSRALINEFEHQSALPNLVEDEHEDDSVMEKLETNIRQSVKDDHVNQAFQSKQVESTDHSKNLLQTLSKSEKICTSKIAEKVNDDDKVSNTSKNSSMEVKTNLELCNVVYCCSCCYMTVIYFDQAVEHCQDHYCGVDISQKILTCTKCKLKYDQKHCEDHQKIHDFQKSPNSFKVLKFDAVYFAVDYKLWIQNMFEKLEPQITESIINRSIYKYEGRVKLTVIQKGGSDIIVYKCKACLMFVDPDDILSHTENSCYKLRQHICSFCGLPFVSHAFRMSHENVHKNKSELTVNSFQIVIFNRDKDKEYNKHIINSRNNFIMFQCRECKGIFERFQNRLHDCNKLDSKKCPICCFFILYSSYKSHMLKHALIRSFTHHNMTVIRFGKENKSSSESSGLPHYFSGVVKDYTFYKCLQCDVYIKKSKSSNITHDCLNDNAKALCSKCNLSFLKNQIIRHNKMHDSDPYFVKENFNLLLLKNTHGECSVSPKEDDSKVNKEIEIEENISLVKVNVEKNMKLSKEMTVVNNIPSIVRVAKIYKCDCRLCFLDKDSISSHFGHCESKTIKQTCTKCSLIFTPKDLFTHLLKHHGDKKYLYKFNIIWMNKTKNKIIGLYNCSICNLHFVECEKAKEHFGNCSDSVSEESKCEHCQLFFEKTCIEFHKNNHHDENVVDFDIIDINEETNDSEENNCSIKINMASQADEVIDVNHRMSNESLSLISLNNYSNTIYKCIDCKVHFLTENRFQRHLLKCGHERFSSVQKDCEHCGLNFSLHSLAKHMYVHHSQMKLDLSQISIRTAVNNND